MEKARQDYEVIINPRTTEVDLPATQKLRDELLKRQQ